jgi:hypothetical protein
VGESPVFLLKKNREEVSFEGNYVPKLRNTSYKISTSTMPNNCAS